MGGLSLWTLSGFAVSTTALTVPICRRWNRRQVTSLWLLFEMLSQQKMKRKYMSELGFSRTSITTISPLIITGEITRGWFEFDQALNVDHYWEIFDREYLELRVLDKKAGLQDKLFNLMLDEQNLARIMELSPYSNSW